MSYALAQPWAGNVTALTTSNCYFGGSISVGDLLVVAFSVASDTETITSVTDILGNTYSVAASGPAGSGTVERPYIAWCISGFAGSSPYATIVKSGTAPMTIQVAPFSGAPATPTVITASGTTAGTPAANPSATITGVATGSLVIGLLVSTNSPTAGSGYTTAASGTANYYELWEYNLSSGSGSIAVNATATSCNWCVAAIAFSGSTVTLDPITSCFPIGYYE